MYRTHTIVPLFLVIILVLSSCGGSEPEASWKILPELCEIETGKSIGLSLSSTERGARAEKIKWTSDSGSFNKPDQSLTRYTPDNSSEDKISIKVEFTSQNKDNSAETTCVLKNPSAATVGIAATSASPTPTAPQDPTSPPSESGPTSTTEVLPTPKILSAPPSPEPTTTPSAATVPGTDTVIKIAVQSPLTGTWGEQGSAVRDAVGLAIRQQNRPITDLGYKLEMIAFDDKGDPQVGKETALASVQDPDVLCVVGHFNSTVTLAAYQEVYRNQRMPVISSSNTNPSVTDFTDNVWRLVGRDDVQTYVGAEFARNNLHLKIAYIIHDNTTYGRAAATFFEKYFKDLGGAVIGTDSYTENNIDVNFMPIIEHIQAKKTNSEEPDLIYFTGAGKQAGRFFKLARASGITAQFIGPDTLDNEQVVTIGESSAVSTYFTTVAAPISKFPQAETFALDYKAEFKRDPGSFTLESYDAATLCIQAIARAASKAGGKKPTREQVIAELASFGRFSGTSGNYTFNSNGDPESVKYYIIQIRERWSENKILEPKFAPPPER